MTTFERFTCANCGTDYAANPDGIAAKNGYCSPACESPGKGLT